MRAKQARDYTVKARHAKYIYKYAIKFISPQTTIYDK